jgi:hypothetical protein
MLSNVRHVQEIIQKLAGPFPGFADTFKHPKSKNEQIPCEASVRNAFNKVAIGHGDSAKVLCATLGYCRIAGKSILRANQMPGALLVKRHTANLQWRARIFAAMGEVII